MRVICLTYRVKSIRVLKRSFAAHQGHCADIERDRVGVACATARAIIWHQVEVARLDLEIVFPLEVIYTARR